MKSLSNEKVFYAFSPNMTPQLVVEQNELFSLETCDCFSNQLSSNEDTIEKLNWDAINPATGPVFIECVKPGDLVRVKIEKVELTGPTVMVTIPGAGRVQGLTKTTTHVSEIKEGKLIIKTEKGTLSFPIDPMVGVIGVAPEEGNIANGMPGNHGGNMDCKLIGEGTALYLRAAVPGALFGCGDIHSLMGDGEVLVCGGETPAKVTLTIAVANVENLPTPFIETEMLYATVASSANPEEAFQTAINEMFDFLTKVAGLEEGDAGRLMTLVGELKFCQVVNPDITVRFEFPKSVLKELGFEGL